MSQHYTGVALQEKFGEIDQLLPSIFFDHMSNFYYEFSFFILLAGFKCMFLKG